MNIFALDNDPRLAAQMMCDKHVVKMTLETAQILSTVMQEKFPNDPYLYKPTHKNHPCVKWVRESYDNFMWLVRHGYALIDEYTYRYGKRHKCTEIFSQVGLHNIHPDLMHSFPQIARTPFILAMPDDCKLDDPVASYRLYYKKYKAGIATWNKSRPQPEWWNES